MPITYDGQGFLIDLMALLKENATIDYDNPEGVCVGLVLLAIQAFLCGKLQEFNQRIDDIYKMHQAKINFKNELLRIQQRIVRRNRKLKKGKKLVLTHEEQKIIDIWAFFDGIALYQNPDYYVDILGKTLAQNQSDKVAPFVNSAAIAQQGGLTKIGQWTGIYNLAELTSYLNILTTSSKNCNQHIALLLSTGEAERYYGHTISLCWDNTANKWYFIDANELPIQEISDKNTDILAAAIFSSYWDKHVTSFETALYAVGNNKKQTQQFLSQLQQSTEFNYIHKMSHAKSTEIKAWDLINQACEAAKEGNANKLKCAIEDGVDLNQADLFYRKTPLDLMATNKEPEILELLALPCEDPTQLSAFLIRMNEKPIYRQVKIIDLFIKKFKENGQCNINLNMIYKFLATSQQPRLLHLLIKYKVNLNELNTDEKSLLSTILENGQTGFVYYYQLIFNTSNKVSRKKFAIRWNKYKDDIDSYLNFLNDKDRQEANTILWDIEYGKNLQKFSIFSRKNIQMQSDRQKNGKVKRESCKSFFTESSLHIVP